ncbi:MAG: hypothetical protein AB1728_09580 [Bacteroidota bacterium]
MMKSHTTIPYFIFLGLVFSVFLHAQSNFHVGIKKISFSLSAGGTIYTESTIQNILHMGPKPAHIISAGDMFAESINSETYTTSLIYHFELSFPLQKSNSLVIGADYFSFERFLERQYDNSLENSFIYNSINSTISLLPISVGYRHQIEHSPITLEPGITYALSYIHDRDSKKTESSQLSTENSYQGKGFGIYGKIILYKSITPWLGANLSALYRFVRISDYNSAQHPIYTIQGFSVIVGVEYNCNI